MYYLSSDVGGTFVDLVLVDSGTNRIFVDKVSSTAESAEGILVGIHRILKAGGISIGQLHSFVHGFTIATNTWLTRRGARVAFLVTDGFRDVLEIGTQRRANLYSLTQQRTPPLVSRSRVLEVRERVDAFGEVVLPLSAAETARIVEATRALEPEAVAVSLLFSFMNDAHERQLAHAIQSALPGVPCYLSSEINPQIEEYARANTTVAAAYVGPAVARYVTALEQGLRDALFTAPLMLMRSDGGVATPQAARRNPATMLLSGPAGGVIAAAALGTAIEVPNLITFDMGGTSADFSLIADGEPRMSFERSVNDQVLRVPMLDIETISAGGGSIASVDHAGALRVGPQSAGSIPGPACYGRGGSEPTLTDAAVVLGIIDPNDFAGGDVPLFPDAAREAIGRQVAKPLAMSIEEAAFSMVAVACAQMRQAIRALSIERGHDLRRFSLLAFGGAGPIFAALMQEELGIEQVLIPPRPGVFAAFGLLLADIKHNTQATYSGDVREIDQQALRARLEEMAASLAGALDRDGVAPGRRIFGYAADMRYTGQFHVITVPLPAPDRPLWWNADEVIKRFHRMHEQAYGHCDRDSPVEFVSCRAEAVGMVEKPRFPKLPRHEGESPATRGQRHILLDRSGEGFATPVYRREDLGPGHRLDGPALISQSDTTVLILPAQIGRVDDHGVIRIRSKEPA